MESFLAEGDEDALVIQPFEDAVIESLQNDPEVAVCLNSYADARRRLQDKSKGRGFWAPRPGKSKGKGKFKGSFKASRTSFVSHLPNASWRVLAEHAVK